jgi:hypothetical protein
VGHSALNAKLSAFAGIIPTAHQTANLARTSTQLFSAQQAIAFRGLFKQISIDISDISYLLNICLVVIAAINPGYFSTRSKSYSRSLMASLPVNMFLAQIPPISSGK